MPTALKKSATAKFNLVAPADHPGQCFEPLRPVRARLEPRRGMLRLVPVEDWQTLKETERPPADVARSPVRPFVPPPCSLDALQRFLWQLWPATC